MSSYVGLKIGDSIVWNITYKQSNNTPINLNGFTINVNAVNKNNNTELFNVSSAHPTSNQYITTDRLASGAFSVVIKDTSLFPKGDYYVDVEYTDAQGIKNSSKSVMLKVLERL